MNCRNIFSLSLITALGLALLPATSGAQQRSLKEQIVGSWTYAASETVRPDGSRVNTWGDSQSGLVIFGADGRYVSLVGRSAALDFSCGRSGRAGGSGAGEHQRKSKNCQRFYFGRGL